MLKRKTYSSFLVKDPREKSNLIRVQTAVLNSVLFYASLRGCRQERLLPWKQAPPGSRAGANTDSLTASCVHKADQLVNITPGTYQRHKANSKSSQHCAGIVPRGNVELGNWVVWFPCNKGPSPDKHRADNGTSQHSAIVIMRIVQHGAFPDYRHQGQKR